MFHKSSDFLKTISYFYLLFNLIETMKRILVTGANGQAGRALRAEEQRDGGGYEWIFAGRDQVDITDRASIAAALERWKPDVIVNCAAYTDVDRAEIERDIAFAVNYDGTRYLAEAASDGGVSLIHISTDYLFDGLQDTPYTESDIPNPINVYGESKLAGARTVLESGGRGAVLRTSLLYSPWGRNFVRSILEAAREGDKIEVVADQRTCPTSAVSLARAIRAMIPALLENDDIAGVYHYCDDGVVSRADFAVEIIRQAKLDCKVVPVSSEKRTAEATAAGRVVAPRPAYSAMNTSKFARDFGFTPPHWKTALAECISAMEE